MEYFAELGARLERGYLEAGHDEEAFPEVAMRALDALPPLEGFDRDAFVDRVLDPWAPSSRQLVPVGVFGQPGITMHHGSGFVVDVYYWLSSLSAIHNHPFCGVFTVLEGFSVHARYGWEEREKLNHRVSLGEARLEGLELVEAGDREPFSLERHPLIHALIHVPVPSISMVVRTIRTEGYRRWFPPAIAMAMDEPGDPFARQLALLESLRQARDPSFPERLLGYLRTADFEIAFRLLARVWGDCDEAERAALLEVLRPRHGERVELVAPALERAFRLHAADAWREGLRDTEARFVATALMLGENRPQILALLGRRIADPLAALHRFVEASGIFDEDPATQVVSHALADGLDLDAIGARAAEAGLDLDRSSLAEFAASSPLGVLTVSD